MHENLTTDKRPFLICRENFFLHFGPLRRSHDQLTYLPVFANKTKSNVSLQDLAKKMTQLSWTKQTDTVPHNLSKDKKKREYVSQFLKTATQKIWKLNKILRFAC